MSNSFSLRLFIAIELSSKLKGSIFDSFAQFHNHSTLIRWIPAANLHVTLNFLGNTLPQHIPLLKSILTKTADALPAFELSVSSCGVFPSQKKPSVLWVGIAQGAVECTAIASKLNQHLTDNGFQQDTPPFKPHITIARTRKRAYHKKIAGLYDKIIETQTNKHIGSSTIQSISLIQSMLTPQGPCYTTLFCSSLR